MRSAASSSPQRSSASQRRNSGGTLFVSSPPPSHPSSYSPLRTTGGAATGPSSVATTSSHRLSPLRTRSPLRRETGGGSPSAPASSPTSSLPGTSREERLLRLIQDFDRLTLRPWGTRVDDITTRFVKLNYVSSEELTFLSNAKRRNAAFMLNVEAILTDAVEHEKGIESSITRQACAAWEESKSLNIRIQQILRHANKHSGSELVRHSVTPTRQHQQRSGSPVSSSPSASARVQRGQGSTSPSRILLSQQRSYDRSVGYGTNSGTSTPTRRDSIGGAGGGGRRPPFGTADERLFFSPSPTRRGAGGGLPDGDQRGASVSSAGGGGGGGGRGVLSQPRRSTSPLPVPKSFDQIRSPRSPINAARLVADVDARRQERENILTGLRVLAKRQTLSAADLEWAKEQFVKLHHHHRDEAPVKEKDEEAERAFLDWIREWKERHRR